MESLADSQQPYLMSVIVCLSTRLWVSVPTPTTHTQHASLTLNIVLVDTFSSLPFVGPWPTRQIC